MDKVKRANEKTVGEIGTSVELWDMVMKLDELVQWINEHETKGDPAPK